MARAHSDPDLWQGLDLEIRFADLFPCLPEWRIDPSVLTDNGLFYIVKGHGWMERAGKRHDLLPGDLAFSRPGQLGSYGHDPRRPITAYSVGFSVRALGGIDPMRGLDLPDIVRLPAAARREIESLYQQAVADFHADAPWSAMAARGSVLRLLSYALRLVEESPAERKIGRVGPMPGELARSSKIVAFVDGNLDKRLTLSGLARVARLSPIHFAKEFRRQCGQSPMAFVRMRRIQFAKARLAAGDEAIDEIAGRVGFDDPYHFSRVFRKLTGLSPSAYRQSLRNPFSR